MIRGIGTDIVAVERIAKMHGRYGDKLAQRLLSAAEWHDYAAAADQARLLAKRFAAKEALAKALGTGLRSPVHLTDVSVAHDALGKPIFHYSTALQAWLTRQGVGNVHLSLSDEAHYAVAFVVAEAG